MHRIEWVRSKVKLENTVLEVGCAENPVWRGTNFKVTTVDKQINPKLEIFPDLQANAEDLPFNDDSFDVVCEGELLEHVTEPQKTLREAVRVAKKKVVITVPDEWSWPPELKPFWNPGHVRFYNLDTIKNELEKLDLPFSIEHIRYESWAWLGAEIHVVRNLFEDGRVQ